MRRDFGCEARRWLPPETAVAEESIHLSMARRAGKGVILPQKQRPGGAGTIVERIGILHEGGFRRGLAEGFHPAESASTMGAKSSAFNEAPPTSAPLTFAMAKTLVQLLAFTEPP